MAQRLLDATVVADGFAGIKTMKPLKSQMTETMTNAAERCLMQTLSLLISESVAYASESTF